MCEVATIVAATTKIATAPANIANEPTPLIAIVPKTTAAAPNANNESPTPKDHFQSGYFSYLPSDSINELTIIAVAIITSEIPPAK